MHHEGTVTVVIVNKIKNHLTVSLEIQTSAVQARGNPPPFPPVHLRFFVDSRTLLVPPPPTLNTGGTKQLSVPAVEVALYYGGIHADVRNIDDASHSLGSNNVRWLQGSTTWRTTRCSG